LYHSFNISLLNASMKHQCARLFF